MASDNFTKHGLLNCVNELSWDKFERVNPLQSKMIYSVCTERK